MEKFRYEIMFLWASVLFLVLCSVSSERTKDKMYEPIVSTVACFRRMNGTHQFGCSSHHSGNVGVIHVVRDENDLKWLVEKAPAEPYTAVIQPDMFTRHVMLKFKESGKVSGVLLVHNQTTVPKNFTHEDTCPNRYSGLSSFDKQYCEDDNPWNPYGTSLMLVDWGFPIFYVKDPDSINKIYNCFNKHNANLENHLSRSLCAVETNAYMFAAVNSETCIRRNMIVTNINPVRFCDPLGDRNVWSTLFPLNRNLPRNTSFVVLAARMDTSSMFDGVAPGAASPVTSIVTLLTTAAILSKMIKEQPLNDSKNVMFLLLNGESFDYVGSSRMVWDMNRGVFPIFLDQLSAFIELDQLKVKNRNVFIHRQSNELTDFVKILNGEGTKMNLSFVDAGDAYLPPASLQTFKKSNGSLPGLVLADFRNQFSNRFYHSIFDNATYISYQYANGSVINKDSLQMLLYNISVTLANSLYQFINGSEYEELLAEDEEISATVVDELLHCYLESMDCPLFRSATAPGRRASPSPSSLYVGVSGWENAITTLTGQALAFLTGEELNLTEVECHPKTEDKYLYQYTWIRGNGSGANKTIKGVCFRSTYNYSIAESPAFEIEDYDWKSGEYSTWSESRWKEFSVRMFLRPSRQHEVATLVSGVVVLIVSFVIVYFTTSRSGTLFCNGNGGNTLVAGC